MIRRYGLPLQLLAVVLFVLFFGDIFSSEMVGYFYTASTVFKELLSVLLPFIIFSFVVSGILSLEHKAPIILSILIACIFVSNVIVAILSYLFVRLALPITQCPEGLQALEFERTFQPYISFAIPNVISPKFMLLGSVMLGILLSIKQMPIIEKAIISLKGYVEFVLLRLFIPLLPLYVFGYLLEIKHRGILAELLKHYGNAIVLILCLQALFIGSFFILATLSFKKGWQALKNAMPSYLTALSTISSTATIPVTVVCAEKNTGNKSLAEIAVPIMANVHLMGAGINIPILSLATLILFKAAVPSFAHYLTFVFYFCTSMFAVTGIPGAGLIVMIPLLTEYFDFSPIMISVLTALYLLLDALSAATNVMGDGALIIIVNKLLKKLKIA